MNEYTKLEELQIANLQDSWSIIYEEMASALIQQCGISGESVLRQGIRDYGIERGTKMRERHLSMGLKLNLKNLFSYFDLPSDPRFKREKISLTPQQRLSYTLVCPIAQQWISDGNKHLGRIYCEEFHHACFSAYAEKSQTNLAKTLTEDGDNYCCFSVYLRPGNMTEQERKEAFEEYDSDYCLSEDFQYDLGTHKDGYNRLSILIIYLIAKEAISQLGEHGETAVIQGIIQLRQHLMEFMKARAEAIDVPCDQRFLEKNMPLRLTFAEETLWNEYCDSKITTLIKKYFYDKIDEFFEE